MHSGVANVLNFARKPFIGESGKGFSLGIPSRSSLGMYSKHFVGKEELTLASNIVMYAFRDPSSEVFARKTAYLRSFICVSYPQGMVPHSFQITFSGK